MSAYRESAKPKEKVADWLMHMKVVFKRIGRWFWKQTGANEDFLTVLVVVGALVGVIWGCVYLCEGPSLKISPVIAPDGKPAFEAMHCNRSREAECLKRLSVICPEGFDPVQAKGWHLYLIRCKSMEHKKNGR